MRVWLQGFLLATILGSAAAVRLQNAPAVVVKPQAKTEAEQIEEAKQRIHLLMAILEHPAIQNAKPLFEAIHPPATTAPAIHPTLSRAQAEALADKMLHSTETHGQPSAHTPAHEDHQHPHELNALQDLLHQLDSHHDAPTDVSSLEKLREVLNHWAASHGHTNNMYYTQKYHHPHIAPLSPHWHHGYQHLPTIHDRKEDTEKQQYYDDISRGYRVHPDHNQWAQRSNPFVHDHKHAFVKYQEKTHDLPVFRDTAAAIAHGYKHPCTEVHPYFPHCDCNPTSKTWPQCTQQFVPNNELPEANPGVPVAETEKHVNTYKVDPLTNQPILVKPISQTTSHHTAATSHSAHTASQLPHIPLEDSLSSDRIPEALHDAATAAALAGSGQAGEGYVVVVDNEGIGR